MKTYYADKEGLDPKDIFVVSIMPCTAKKFEIGREDQSASGYPDIDVSLTTRELAAMIKRAGLMFTELPDENLILSLVLLRVRDIFSVQRAVDGSRSAYGRRDCNWQAA